MVGMRLTAKLTAASPGDRAAAWSNLSYSKSRETTSTPVRVEFLKTGVVHLRTALPRSLLQSLFPQLQTVK